LTGTDGQELDSCLVGTWAVDPESMAAYLMTAMNQGGEQLFTVDSIEGDLFMTFTSSGEMSMNSNDYRLKILFSTAGLNFEMNMVLDAAGTATYTADGANISNWNRNYVSSGNPLEALLSAVSGSGSEIVFAVTPDWFTAGIVEIDGDEPSEATYMCEGDTLSLQPTEYGPVLFNRVD
jgi:hypothetical protein